MKKNCTYCNSHYILLFVREIEEYLSSIFLKCIKSVHSSPFKSYYLGEKSFKIRRKATGPEHS